MSAPAPALDDLPGYRRRFRVTHGSGWVRSAVEDDYHHMAVTLRHQDGVATAVEPEMIRAPWTTCPGAVAELQRTFEGLALEAFPARGGKSGNCTHLHDLALLAAAHAQDREPLQYDILTSDPVDGRRRMELRRNGQTLMSWVEQDGLLVEPAEVAGTRLDKLSPWIATLEPELQEAARILRWGAIVAHGRSIPLENQSDATRMPPTCFTFQPHRAAVARRVGEIRDFSLGTEEPLEERLAASSGPGEKRLPTNPA